MLSRHALLARRALLVLLVLSLSVGAAALSARAQLEQTLLTSTRALLDMPSSWLRGPARKVVMNGARFELSSGRSELALQALLDRLQAACRQQSGGLSARLSALSASSSRAVALPGFADGVLRVENEREGVVACFAPGREALTLDALRQRIERFAGALDLAELGGVRFVRAEARERGSFFVAVQNLGPAPLSRMFPARGDAPGIDPPAIPRPPVARRMLSAYQEEREAGIFIYESERAGDELWAAYVQALREAGYESGMPFGSSYAHAALFTREGSALVVALERLDQARSRVVLLPSGGALAR